jgi:phytoene synthase
VLDGALTIDSIKHCESTLKENSKSFSFAAKLLSPEIRGETAALYAWCRHVDDAVDEVEPHLAPAALEALKLELDEIYSMTPCVVMMRDPTLAAFRAVVIKSGLPRYYPEQLLEGMKMDVEGHSYHNLEDLYRYCYRVASVVGLMMCHITGLSTPEALKNAAHLGLAMQLTNICRDVSEDWGRGRLYLPTSLIHSDAHALSLSLGPDQLIPRFSQGVRFTQRELPSPLREAVSQTTLTLLARADEHYEIGLQGVRALPWRAALAVRSAAIIYREIGLLVKDRQGEPNAPRARTSLMRKVALSVRSTCHEMLTRCSSYILRSQRTFDRLSPDHVLTFEELMSSNGDRGTNPAALGRSI